MYYLILLDTNNLMKFISLNVKNHNATIDPTFHKKAAIFGVGTREQVF